MPVFKGAAGGIDRAQRMVPATHQQPLGHDGTQVTCFLSYLGDVAQKVGNDAVYAIVGGVELLVGVL
jgi:hypothetical protein